MRGVQFCRSILITGAWLCALLSIVCIQRWRNDNEQIRRISATSIVTGPTQYQVLKSAVHFVSQFQRKGYNGKYFLSPMFSFLRPTALQVFESGGDCGYLSRALVVTLQQFGITASKRTVFYHGAPSHVIVVAETKQGNYVADPLFGVVYEDEHGGPLSLQELRKSAVLHKAMRRAVRRGESYRGARYPHQYYLRDVRTVDWRRSKWLYTAYRFVEHSVGRANVNSIRRPYFLEEPALMVAALGLAAAVSLSCAGRMLSTGKLTGAFPPSMLLAAQRPSHSSQQRRIRRIRATEQSSEWPEGRIEPLQYPMSSARSEGGESGRFP